MSSNALVHYTFRSFTFGLSPLLLTAVLVLVGCDTTDVADEDRIESIAISPDSVALEVGEQVDFDVVALTASGDTVENANLTLRWWSSDTTVFTVEENGLATGQGSGKAFCKVEATGGEVAGKTAASGSKRLVRVPIGRDSAVVHMF